MPRKKNAEELSAAAVEAPMSEGRGKYSTTPLYGLRHNNGGGGFGVPPEKPDRSRRSSQRNTLFLTSTMICIINIVGEIRYLMIVVQ